MIIFVAILLIILGILAALAAVYGVYCVIGAGIFNKKVKRNGKDALDAKNRLNLIVWIIKKSRKVRDAASNELKRIINRKVIIATLITISLIVNFIYTSFFCLSVGVVVYNMDQQITTISTVLQMLFMKDDDCKCYALCTGDKEDDEQSVYELLFGPTEYDKLVNHMKLDMSYELREQFDEIDGGTDGKAKSDILKENINEEMVNDYKSIVGNNSKFRSGDGLDRSQMSFDELKADLYNLLSDYKVNGRNPNCDCATCAKIQLKRKCLGMAHYKEGWSWDAIWDSIGGKDNSDNNTSNVPGTATGQYAIQLDDGSFYWYHQSRETCAYNAHDDSYGYVGLLYAGGTSYGTMSKRGCGIYSTAIALSNILGEEVTPWDVITNVMGCTIQGGSGGSLYFESYSTNGIAYTCDSPSYSFSSMANLINAAYGGKGVVAKEVEFTEDSLNTYFDDDSMYAYVINSYENSGYSDSSFTWYGGAGHFMVLRKTGDNQYKCFTSASTKYGSTDDKIAKGMNDSVSWSTVAAHARHSTCIVITRDKSYYNTGGSGGGEGTLTGGTVLDFTAGGNFECPYSNCNTYMGWQMITVPGSSNQASLITSHFSNWGNTGGSNKDNPGDDSAFDSEGFGKIDGRYVVATTWKNNGGIANIGDKIDVYLENGVIIKCIVGDIKSSGDSTWTKWGHMSGSQVSTIEFIVNRNNSTTTKWYSGGHGSHANPGTANCHPEWKSDIVKIMVGGTEQSSSSSGAASGSSSSSGESSSNTSDANSVTRNNLIKYAQSFVGSHYVYGGDVLGCRDWSDNVGIDCSGFVNKVYAHFGYSVARDSAALRSAGREVKNPSVSNMLPGDIICYSGHVAIYIGNGQIVHASTAKSGVKISNTWNYKTVITVRRVIE